MHLMDIVTTYLYDSLDNYIYIKTLEGIKIPEIYKSSSREICSIKLQRLLYIWIETIIMNVVQSP